MGLIAKLKDKIVGKRYEEPDYDTVRSAVLGNANMPVNPAGPRVDEKDLKPGWRTKYEQAAEPEQFATNPYEPVTQAEQVINDFGRERGNVEKEKRIDKREMYELLDRLSIIEAQLTAIRSQTETINERLKLMEIRTSRRY
ncbi:MAG: hypothetical protein HZB65_03385 [Candidatus Aenigmarchaeota archaeon]|nr:hypothetical protein [Candidatus Aenigmarchaeota archaeon]